MEDSEKRRERLKAMRTEAAQADASSYVNASAASGFLANPLLESPVQEVPYATPRFDFYTDPMAAFSANRRSGAGNQAAQEYFMPPSNSSSSAAQFSSPPPGSWNPSITPSPAHQMQNYHSLNPSMTPSPTNQMQNCHSPNQRMHRLQGPYYNAAFHGSPRFTPFPMHRGTLDARGGSGRLAYSSPSHRSPYPVHEGNPGFQPRGSPTFNNSQTWMSNSPSIGSGHRGSVNRSGRGQGQWHGGSRSQFSGQSSGGGRGRGLHSHGSAPDEKLRPESFYDKSMFEDPWQHLEPVVWRGQDSSAINPHSGSWLPASISKKKARVSEPSKKFSSEQSLAEYLAQSFNEAASNTPSE
ncbi:protein SICKLE [Euphorbia lathyris]|uniref:protein SICKLE n=1 Tax=Euphorbia lathyris TaxID=212925 RepID=UPI003313217D